MTGETPSASVDNATVLAAQNEAATLEELFGITFADTQMPNIVRVTKEEIVRLSSTNSLFAAMLQHGDNGVYDSANAACYVVDAAPAILKRVLTLAWIDLVCPMFTTRTKLSRHLQFVCESFRSSKMMTEHKKREMAKIFEEYTYRTLIGEGIAEWIAYYPDKRSAEPDLTVEQVFAAVSTLKFTLVDRITESADAATTDTIRPVLQQLENDVVLYGYTLVRYAVEQLTKAGLSERAAVQKLAINPPLAPNNFWRMLDQPNIDTYNLEQIVMEPEVYAQFETSVLNILYYTYVFTDQTNLRAEQIKFLNLCNEKGVSNFKETMQEIAVAARVGRYNVSGVFEIDLEALQQKFSAPA